MNEIVEQQVDFDSLKAFVDARLSVLKNDEERLELRAIFNDGVKVEGEYFGRFDHEEILSRIEDWSDAKLVMTLNPTLKKSIKSEGHVSNTDVIRGCWLLVDVDPIRQQDPDRFIRLPREHLTFGFVRDSLYRYLQGFCSTGVELESARSVVHAIVEGFGRQLDLKDENYLLALSGNGFHLLLRIDTDTSKETDDDLFYVCSSIEQKFSSDLVRVEAKAGFSDTSRVIGPLNDKRESAEHGRTRRISRVIHCPDTFVPVAYEKLRAVAEAYRPMVDQMIAAEKAKKRQSKTRPCRKGWSQLAEAHAKGNLNRRLPEIDFMRDRIGYGDVCPKCGMRSRQCLSGTETDGNEWVLCWRYEAWDGEEGADYLKHDLGSMGIGAFYWQDGTAIYNAGLATESPQGDFNQGTEIPEETSFAPKEGQSHPSPVSRPEPKDSYLPGMRDGLLKDIALYFRIAFNHEKGDALALFNALNVISLMNHNRFRLKVGEQTSPLNLWLLLIAESGTGKSSMFDKHRQIYNAVVQNLGLGRDYRLPYADTCSIEAFVETVSLAPHKVFTFRSDEIARFFRESRLRELQPAFMGLFNGEYDTLFKLNAGGKAKESKKNLSDLFRGVEGVQFNLLAQTTKRWLFEEARLENFENGFFGRFFTFYDDDTTGVRALDLYDRDLKDKIVADAGRFVGLQEVVDRCSRFFVLLDEFSAQPGGTIKWHQDPDLLDLGSPKRPDEKRVMKILSPPDWTLSYFVRKFRSMFFTFKSSDAIERAIYNRLVHLTMKVAALIELSHLGDEQQAWSNCGSYVEMKEISIRSVMEACEFVLGESVKWIRLIREQAVDSATEKYANALQKYLREHFSQDAKEYRNLDGSGFLAVTRKDIKKRGTLRTSGQIDLAVENLAAFDEIEIRNVKAQNGREVSVLLWLGKEE